MDRGPGGPQSMGHKESETTETHTHTHTHTLHLRKEVLFKYQKI